MKNRDRLLENSQIGISNSNSFPEYQTQISSFLHGIFIWINLMGIDIIIFSNPDSDTYTQIAHLMVISISINCSFRSRIISSAIFSKFQQSLSVLPLTTPSRVYFLSVSSLLHLSNLSHNDLSFVLWQ